MPWERPRAICTVTELIFWAMPMAATALEPKAEVKLFSTLMPVTLSRFWMEAGMPTAHTPTTMCRLNENILGLTHT